MTNSFDSNFQLSTPVIFLIFNRPDTTERVFKEIARAKPSKLFVVADGPRPNRADDLVKCKEARSVINNIDWECEVYKNFAETNLGCKNRVSSGISWAFNQIDEAIILEDDCLPHPTFFRYCQELLTKYRFDNRMMVISGNNFQLGNNPSKYSYYFSRYGHNWGWATWRRAWDLYDGEMKRWPELSDEGWLDNVVGAVSAEFWKEKFQSTYERKVDSWANRLLLSMWAEQGLGILPSVNLVSNIGFNENASHTTHVDDPLAALAIEPMEFPLKHPPFVIRHSRADSFTEQKIYHHYHTYKSSIRRLLKNLKIYHKG